MEKTTNFFESWIENQNKLIDNWTNMVQDVQKNWLNNPVAEKGTELYNNWINQQQEALNQLKSKTTEATEETRSRTAEFFDRWQHGQKQAADSWNQAFTNWINLWQGKNTASNPLADVSRNWTDAMNRVAEAFRLPSTNNAWGNATQNTLKDSYNSMLKGAEAYASLFRMWQPVLEAVQKNVLSPEELSKLINPSFLKEYIDKTFRFDTLEAFTSQYANYTSKWFETASQYRSVLPAFREGLAPFNGMLAEGQHLTMNAWRDAFAELRKAWSPFFRLNGDQDLTEQLGLSSDLSEYYGEALDKLTRLQYLTYQTAGKANDELLDQIIERGKSSKSFARFDELNNEWTNLSGKHFEGLFASDEYSRLQGELITLDAKIRTNLQKQLENVLAPFPVVLRSQLDEVHKANYDLRKRVHALEKQLSSLNGKASAKQEEETENTTAGAKANGTANRKKA